MDRLTLTLDFDPLLTDGERLAALIVNHIKSGFGLIAWLEGIDIHTLDTCIDPVKD